MSQFKLLFLIALFFISIANTQDISPWLFGQNHWMANNDEGGRPGYLYKLWPEVEKSGVTLVRIGGIGYENDFPDNQRLTAMIDSIRGIGAEPLVQVPRHFSNEQATTLVKDFKYSNGTGIRFYSIGNEPICNDVSDETIENVYQYLTRLAPVMKAADPSIRILVFDACTFYQEAYAAFCGGRLDLTGKDKNGNWMIDGFTFHNYPNGREFDRENVVFSGPASIASQAKQLVQMMDTANKKHGRSGKAKLMWGLTEVNVTYANPNREISGYGNPSFLGGQFIAEIYGIGMEYGAFTVAPWCISETDRVRTDFGYLGLPEEFYPRSSYYHTQMMAQNMQGKFLPTKSNNSYVTSIASISDDKICIMLLNKDQEHDYDFDIILNTQTDTGKPLVVRAGLGLDTVISGQIPNQTTVMYVLSISGDIQNVYTYSLTHNLKHQPPFVEEY